MRVVRQRSLVLCVLATLAWSAGAAFAGAVPAPSAGEDALLGIWAGALPEGSVQGDNQEVYFEVARRSDGGLKASFGIAMGTGQFAESVTLKDAGVRISSRSSQLHWEGTLAPDGTSMEGKLVIGEWWRPLPLRKVDRLPGPPRPQTPYGPYPYEVRNVRYRNDAAQLALAGTLTLPPGRGPFAAVLLICGSGPGDRNADALYHRPLAVLADYLTRRGIAVLRADKRGVGESEGDWAKSDVTDFAGDALAGLQYLAGLTQVDPKRMGLMGISEGGMVAPMAATMSEDVSFVVALSGPAMKWLDVIVLQDGDQAITAGASQEQAEIIRAWSRRFYTVVRDTEDLGEARARLAELKKARTPAETEAFAFLGDSGTLDIDTVLEPNLRNCFKLDPGQYLAELRCPVLSLFGEKDCQVAAGPNRKAAEEAFRSSGNKHATALTLPDVNHCMMRCRSGAVSEYARIDETISPDVLKLLGDWIEAQTEGATPRNAGHL